MLAVAGGVAAAQQPQTVWSGVFTREQADRGQKIYERECARCHADDLTGIEAAPALIGANFAATWEGTSLDMLFERMRSSMPQDKPGSLSRAENADTLAYMLRVSGFPAGEMPLEGNPAALMQITFRSYRPQ
jgi:quinoprotein glucose dehydrogenase